MDRAKAVKESVASLKMEGFFFTPEESILIEKFAKGEISHDDVKAFADSKLKCWQKENPECFVKDIYYEDTGILRNKFNINDQDKLNQMERLYVIANLTRLKEALIQGDFDMKHLQRIHKQLFNEIYAWAGETRNFEIAKGTLFCPLKHLDSYQNDIFQGLKKENYLKDMDTEQFSKRAAHYLGELNMLHPFMEGNGRTQREFIRQLAYNAGYKLSLDNERITQAKMIEASVKSARGYNDEFEKLIRENIRP